MAIINRNPIVLKDSGLTLNETVISGHTSGNTNNKPTTMWVRMQSAFFLNMDKMYESPTNALKVVGYEDDKSVITFDYPVDVINGRYVLDLYYSDLKLKENLMRCFPMWDENLLEITTKPIE